MSTRLQVLLEDAELREIRKIARQQGMSVSEWVRAVLRDARRREAVGDVGRRLATVRAAATHSFPAPDMDEMNAEIARGYLHEEP